MFKQIRSQLILCFDILSRWGSRMFFAVWTRALATPVFTRTRLGRAYVRGAVVAVAVIVGLIAVFGGPKPAQAAVSDNLNFQARLERATGGVASDGDYNIRFKIYDASSGGTQLWTESYLVSNNEGVEVVNGYISVNLGSVTGFPNDMPWDQSLYATMEIGGTDGTPDWDGEMNPRLKLTAVPYAFQAQNATQLQASDAGNVATLSFATPTADNSIVLPNASGTVCLQSSASCGFAASSGSSSYLWNGTSQQTANFNIQSAAGSSVGAIIQGASDQSVDIFRAVTSASAGLTVSSDGQVNVSGTLSVGADTNLYRSAANTLKTDDKFAVGTLGSDGTSVLCLNASNEVASCGSGVGSGSFVFNGTSAQTGNINLQSANSANVTAVFQGAASQTADVLQVKDAASTPNTLLSISSTGAATFKAAADSDSIFSVKSPGNTTLLSIGTQNSGANVLTNPSFEQNTTGWSTASLGGTFTQTNSAAYSGTGAAQLVTTSSGHGIKQSYSLPANTAYSFSFYIKADANTTVTYGFYRTTTGSFDPISCASGVSVTTSWSRKTCTFTTYATMNGDKGIYIRANDGVTHTFHIDAVQLELGSTVSPYSEGTLSFGGSIVSSTTFRNSSNSSSAFAVQNAEGVTVMGVDTTNRRIFSTVADGASAVGFGFNTGSLTTSGAKLLSVMNNGTERFNIDKDGNTTASGDAAINGGDITSSQTTFNLLNSTVTTLNVGGAVGSGGILLAGGSSSTGCTLDGSNGNWACSGTFNGQTLGSSASFTGSATVANGLTVTAGATALGGTLTTTGTATFNGSGNGSTTYGVLFRNGTNSTTAFQVQNAAGSAKIFNIDTSNGRVGIGTDAPSYSLDVQGGDINTSANIRTGGTTRIDASGNGTLASLTVPSISTLNASTADGISMLAGSSSLNSGTGAAISILGGNQTGTTSIGGSVGIDAGTGTSQNGNVNIGATNARTIAIGNTTSTTVVSFAAGSNGMTLSQSAFEMAATASATGRTMRIAQAASGNDGDTFTIQAGQGSVTGDRDGGNILLQAGAGGGSGSSGAVVVKAVDTANTSSFEIQNTVAGKLFSADTSSNMRIIIGSGTPTLASTGLGDLFISGSLEVGKAVLIGTSANGAFFDGTTFELTFTGTARHARTITLAPAYAGGAARGDGSNNAGTLATSFCSGSSLLNIPSSSNPCGSTEQRNYYEWTADATNDMDIWTTLKLPTDFSAFDPTNAFVFHGWGTDTTETAIITVYSGSTSCGTFTLTGNGTWQSNSITASTITTNCAGLVAGSTLTIDVKLTVGTNGNYARAGEILVNYLSRY